MVERPSSGPNDASGFASDEALRAPGGRVEKAPHPVTDYQRIAAAVRYGEWTTMAACFPNRSARENLRVASRLQRTRMIEIDRHFRVRAIAK